MKILITGASGFVGRYVVNQLLSTDHEIIIASRNDPGDEYPDRVIYKHLDLGSLNEDENYFESLGKPDHLIHLAWQGLPNYKSLFHFEENLPVQYAFLKNMVVNGLHNITVTGTCLEYGMKEGKLSEDMNPDPQNPYAVAKDSLRKFLCELQKHQPFILKWVRLFYMYGQGQNPNSLLSQLEKSLANEEEVFNMSGGEQLRDYLPVEEVAENIVTIALQDEVPGIINCCSGVPVSVISFVENYLRKTGRSIKLKTGYYPYTDYEPMAFWGDDTKLKSILNNEQGF